MGKQILNRREKIYTSDIPPEIPDISGFIEDDDYATSSKGGTIKVDSTYAIELTSGGKLKAKEIATEAYSEASDAAFVSKATLDNVIAALPQPSGGGAVQVYSGEPVTIETNKEITLSEDVSNKAFLVVQILTLENRYATAIVSFAGTTIGSESQSQVNAGYMAANAQSTLVLYCRLSANNKLKLTYATGTPGSIIAIFAV